jgi:ABC-2 type transport system ATP-binding protein
VRVRSPRAGELAAVLAKVAFRNGLLLHELSPRRASLEEAYMSLTQDAVEYRAHTTPTTSRTAKAENQ